MVPEPLANMDSPLTHLIRDAFAGDATDVFFIEGEPPRVRRGGEVVELHPGPVNREAMGEFWASCGVVPEERSGADLSWRLPDGRRLRVNLYRSLGRLAAVLRPIKNRIPALAELGLPAPLLESWMARRYGLVLVTGPTGSGKSTTVAACLDWINRNLARHIVTLEDPIEYQFENDLSYFSQREVFQDCESFAAGLRAAMRQSPDVLFIGEIRDAETALTALHAAETGHLVLSTMHCGSVAETVERFTHLLGQGNAGALALLSNQLLGVVSQQLLPRLGGGLFPALEYMQNEAATRRWILEGRFTEIQDHLRKADGRYCCALLDYLLASARQGFIDPEIARAACPRPQDFDRAMRGISG